MLFFCFCILFLCGWTDDRIDVNKKELGFKKSDGQDLFLCGRDEVIDADGNVYPTVQIYFQCWLQKNMNLGEMISITGIPGRENVFEKYCFNDKDENCDRNTGGLYTREEAMNGSFQEGSGGICPAGFRIPTNEDWNALEMYLKNPESSCEKNRTFVHHAGNPHFGCAEAGLHMAEGGFSGFDGVMTPSVDWMGSLGEDGNVSGGYFWQEERRGAVFLSSTKDSHRMLLKGDFSLGRVSDASSGGIFSVRCVR